ncbi:hypothetical protein [Streptomyces sp. NRRL S-1022]|uniref:hypothetical protein n=1 Tax=Streptomyces sp. NRRL S-1022 TaxID=1463880 RepID=UPI000A969E71|nr:hypothetical protein [Streptomyces sp. NRRL S-1022]
MTGRPRYEPHAEGVGAAPPAVRVEQAPADCHRLVLRGQAGSNKSAPLQWWPAG